MKTWKNNIKKLLTLFNNDTPNIFLKWNEVDIENVELWVDTLLLHDLIEYGISKTNCWITPSGKTMLKNLNG